MFLLVSHFALSFLLILVMCHVRKSSFLVHKELRTVFTPHLTDGPFLTFDHPILLHTCIHLISFFFSSQLRTVGKVQSVISTDATWSAFNGDVHRKPGKAMHGGSAGTGFLEYAFAFFCFLLLLLVLLVLLLLLLLLSKPDVVKMKRTVWVCRQVSSFFIFVDDSEL